MTDIDQAVERARDRLREASEREGPVVSKVALFSGGNDSTVMLHVVRDLVDAVAHINTGIGIEETREFVRQTCRDWELTLFEEHPPVPYEDLVMRWGFPGPAGHRIMYNRLKERPLRKVRSKFQEKRGERVMFITGVRQHESARRFYAGYDPINREGAMVWVNPLFDFNTEMMNAYREAHSDVPRNPVADLLHMSGECLCGAFAHEGEIEEIALWYPEVAARIHRLEERLAEEGPDQEVSNSKCLRWGWGAYRGKGQVVPPPPGPLCSGCSVRAAVEAEA